MEKTTGRIGGFVEPALWILILIVGAAVFWRPTLLDFLLRGRFGISTAIVLAVTGGLVIRIAWRFWPRRAT